MSKENIKKLIKYIREVHDKSNKEKSGDTINKPQTGK